MEPALDAVVLDAERTAALIAPVIDRLRLAVSRRARELGAAEVAASGLEPHLLDVLGMLRNRADEAVRADEVPCVYAYRPVEQVRSLVAQLVATGHLVPDGPAVRLGPAALPLVAVVQRCMDQAAGELWAPREESLSALGDLAGAALAAARPDGGPAFRIMAPAVPAPGTSDAAVLAEQLGGLRFHRYDAHVAAWTAAGRTAAEMTVLPAGEERGAIEQETNRRAATPYAALDPEQRLELLAGLAALPG